MKDSAASGEPGGGGGGGGSGDKKELELEKKVEESGKEPSDEGAKKDESEEGKGDGDGKGEGKEEKKEGGDKKGDKGSGEADAEEVKLVEAEPVTIPVIQRTLADLFYRIGFWILLCLVLVMAICWYSNVRYLRRLLAHYEPSRPMHVTS